MSSESFGPKLRWQRIRQGVSLEDISADSKVSVDLWEAMERDDFSAWPRGLYARAYVRHYAESIGMDGDEVVNEFCRLFPTQGNRRRDTLVRGQAEIVGHRFSALAADLPPGVREDRRASERSASAGSDARRRRSAVDLRIAAAVLDQVVVIALAAAIDVIGLGHFWMALAIVALLYHGAGAAAAGSSPGALAVRSYAARHPQAVDQPDVFAPLPRSVDHP
jgi:helix-turn-helix protein